ncbi:hypothetical protein BJ878DRAFT_542281 [Calycina marina]|uniref:Uncharacterized protein n=1 Tax=Calycina marina TaxID=1763456 RepID=A0A9P8CF76_9HELO|nr:hypothetical protein BJ878DRAFT_542281 [Calycina marina]
MSSSLLFNITGVIFAVLPIPHTQMFMAVLKPGLRGANGPSSMAAAISWNQANGYFITTALLCFKWAKQGGVPQGIEKYIFAALIATQLATAAAYARKGVMGPPALYVTASALMGIAAAKGI